MLPEVLTKESSPGVIRSKILEIEAKMASMPGAVFGDDCCPLKHTFADGSYIREITMPAGMLVTSKIHKVCHPYFVLSGDVSVLTDQGVVRIKAPFSGITQAGTKRILYIHEETIWITVHLNPTNTQDLEKIEEEIIAKDFDELDNIIDLQLYERHRQEEEVKV